MTNTELLAKIKAEIKRRITNKTFGGKLELIDILAWLDTLESENPMNQDELEEELINEADRKFFRMAFYEGNNHELLLDCVSLEEFRGIARHFAEWGAEHLKK